ncbi:hypothetical protein MESS2_650033 [Mesorhizobium metallidurans STM 2683]|uniref:Uncharacterized protein n=1 Tax=Mesorhizobium metallidurans STM 2683 TaxID=1297569 RepID=M5EV45_9HYPH|nr:hypothetical protein MESS2_650033 [Mesorhizobium metallidurans STM 2683]
MGRPVNAGLPMIWFTRALRSGVTAITASVPGAAPSALRDTAGAIATIRGAASLPPNR